MKALSKPISSPGKGEKFPPPLMMRFLRSNVGSRSRGRLRASPMFYLRTKRNAIESTQEPSSPKVTCIGQVRVRRSSKSKPRTTPKKGDATAQNRLCWWLKKTLYWPRISFRLLHKPATGGGFRCFIRKWGLYFCTGYCKRTDAREDSFRVDLNQETERNSRNSIESETNSTIQENKGDFLESSSAPPRNALLLTRCRSAPYRASSLAGRFWGSPLAAAAEEAAPAAEDDGNEVEAKSKHEFHQLKTPSCSNSHVSDEMEDSVNNIDEFGRIAGSVHPLLLTRCKSEPARTAQRLIPQPNFLKQTRLGNNS